MNMWFEHIKIYSFSWRFRICGPNEPKYSPKIKKRHFFICFFDFFFDPPHSYPRWRGGAGSAQGSFALMRESKASKPNQGNPKCCGSVPKCYGSIPTCCGSNPKCCRSVQGVSFNHGLHNNFEQKQKIENQTSEKPMVSTSVRPRVTAIAHQSDPE